MLIWYFGSAILKQETFIFQNNAEQSKLNALNETHSLIRAFFLERNTKNA